LANAGEALWRRLTVPESERRKLIDDYRQAVLAERAEAPVPHSFAQVQGRCPACRHHALFLGDGGYITCGNLQCTNPCAANDMLEQP
jgi:hypothetical protein